MLSRSIIYDFASAHYDRKKSWTPLAMAGGVVQVDAER
jgi:hypothetical protein